MVKHPLSIEGVADRILAGDVIVGKEELIQKAVVEDPALVDVQTGWRR